MSIESAKLFAERMKTDKEFAKKISKIKDTEIRMAFLKESGYDLTPAQINEASGELTDDDLEHVAGGIPGHNAFPVD